MALFIFTIFTISSIISSIISILVVVVVVVEDLFVLYHVCECFVSMYICAPHACLLLEVSSRGC